VISNPDLSSVIKSQNRFWAYFNGSITAIIGGTIKKAIIDNWIPGEGRGDGVFSGHFCTKIVRNSHKLT